MLNPFHWWGEGGEGGLPAWWGLGEDGKRGQTPRGWCLQRGANPGECSALLELLVGGQDQRQFHFCCTGKVSTVQENGSGNAFLPHIGYIFGLVCLSLG